MKLESNRIIFATVALIGILLLATPTIRLFITPPSNQQFSEIYILGPNEKMADYPFNITKGVTYSIYLGVTNNMGSSEYYSCYVKIQNLTCPLPNTTLGTPSPQPTLYEYKSFLMNGETWKAPLTFQVNTLTITNGTSQLVTLSLNGIQFNINQVSAWNSTKSGYYYRLVIELWMFDSTLGTSQFNNRYVSLALNMTS